MVPFDRVRVARARSHWFQRQKKKKGEERERGEKIKRTERDEGTSVSLPFPWKLSTSRVGSLSNWLRVTRQLDPRFTRRGASFSPNNGAKREKGGAEREREREFRTPQQRRSCPNDQDLLANRFLVKLWLLGSRGFAVRGFEWRRGATRNETTRMLADWNSETRVSSSTELLESKQRLIYRVRSQIMRSTLRIHPRTSGLIKRLIGNLYRSCEYIPP